MDKRRWAFLFRLLISVALIGGLAYYAGSAAVVERLRSIHWSTLVLAVLILATSFVFVTPRWALILDAFGHRIRARLLVGSVLLGFLFNQLLPTAVGGEVVRIWRARQLGVPVDLAIYSILIDRASGVFVSLAGAALLLPFASPLHGKGTLGWILNAAAILGVVGCAALWWINWITSPRSPFLARLHMSLSKIWDGLEALFGNPAKMASVLALACINQGLLVATIWLFGSNWDLGLSLVDFALITSMSTLAATLPLSFAGWGIREGALVYLFGLYDVPPDVALAISILYGIAQSIAAAPGVLLLLGGGFKETSAE